MKPSQRRHLKLCRTCQYCSSAECFVKDSHIRPLFHMLICHMCIYVHYLYTLLWTLLSSRQSKWRQRLVCIYPTPGHFRFAIRIFALYASHWKGTSNAMRALRFFPHSVLNSSGQSCRFVWKLPYVTFKDYWMIERAENAVEAMEGNGVGVARWHQHPCGTLLKNCCCKVLFLYFQKVFLSFDFPSVPLWKIPT